jgi:iron complex outermembrane receptor protein
MTKLLGDLRKEGGLLVALSLLVGSVWAQSSSNPQPTNVSGSGRSGSSLEEIVVTAQRREQKLQDVPISVSAFGADELARVNVTNAVDLSKVDPSLYVSEATGAVTSFVRGIGNPIGNTGSESSVAYYVDGVYYARLPASYFQFNNIDRVEVLAGSAGHSVWTQRQCRVGSDHHQESVLSADDEC